MTKSSPDPQENSKSKKKRRSKTKPRVKSFLRQATAIIAAEKGMNAAAQQKLQNLAEHLKMPDEEFDEAVARLQESQKMSAGLNRYEKEFAAFLQQEFEQIQGGVMTVVMESKAIDLASRKYDILEPRARQLIQDQAEAMGIGRISRGDAESYVEQLIISRIGDANRIEDDSRQRFYKIAQKWGVGKAEVDSLVLQAIGENRQLEMEAKVTSGKTWVTLVVFLLLIVSGTVLTIFAQEWFGASEADNLEPAPTLSAEVLSPLVMPSWWHAHDMERIVEGLEERGMDDGWIRRLASGNRQQKSEGLSRLLSLTEERTGGEARELQEFLSSYFFACPEDAFCIEVLQQIGQQLDLPASRIPAKFDKLKMVYAANRNLGYLHFFQPLKKSASFEKRSSQIEQLIAREFGEGPFGEDFISYLQTTTRVISINQWNHLIQTSWASPQRTADLIQPLFDLTQSRLQIAELNRLHRRTVMSVLESDASTWSGLKNEISKAISESPDSTINTWINHYENVALEAYREWLGLKLVQRCGLELDSESMLAVGTALKQVKTGNRREQFRELLTRNAKVDRIADTLQNNFQTSGMTPQLVIDVAHAVNLSMLLAPPDQSSFQFEPFDLLYRKGSPNLATLARKSMQSNEGGQGGSATRSDWIHVRETLEKLKRDDPKQRESRLTALRRLAEIAVRLDGLNYQDAEVLAEYYFQIKSDRERLQAEKLLPQLIRLPTFGLAISEKVIARDVTLDQALTMAQYCSEDGYDLKDPVRWRKEIQQHIVDSVTERIDQASEEVTDLSQRWRFLREDYADLCLQRVKVLGAPNQVVRDSNAVVSLRLLVSSLLEQAAVAGVDYPVERAVEVLESQSRSELSEVVALNKLQVKLLAEQVTTRWPALGSEVDSIVSTIQSDAKTTLAEMMLATEFALLKLWTLERQSTVQRLVTR